MKKTLFSLCLFIALAVPSAVWIARQRYFAGNSVPAEEHIDTTKKKHKKIAHTIKHLALIMDGNRRWARKQGLADWEGHQKGTEPVKTAVRFCVDQEIPYLSLYAFSLENFKRSEEELGHLFGIIKAGLSGEEFEELLSKGVRVRFIGERSRFPQDLLDTVESIESKTSNGKKLTLNILFCYGGRQEIVAATKQLVKEVLAKKLSVDDIDLEQIQKHLWTADTPDPDLIIRTGGEKRLSNFMPWQSTYGELMFVDKYWPEITYDDLVNAVEYFANRTRRFGK